MSNKKPEVIHIYNKDGKSFYELLSSIPGLMEILHKKGDELREKEQ